MFIKWNGSVSWRERALVLEFLGSDSVDPDRIETIFELDGVAN